MAWDQEADFEEGDVTDFDATTASPTASTDSAKNGTYGCEITGSGATNEFGQLTGPTTESYQVCEMWMDLNSLAMDTDASFLAMYATKTGGGGGMFQLYIYYDGTNYEFLFSGTTDGGSWTSARIDITDAWHHFRAIVQQSSAPAADDGYAKLYVDNELKHSETTIDNDTIDNEQVQYGYVSGHANNSGTIYLDDCRWSNSNEPFLVILVGTITNTGAVTKAIDLAHGFAGSITNTGAVTKAIDLASGFAGSITNTGALVKQTNKTVAGIITNTGSLFKQINKIVVGALTNTGALKTIIRLSRIIFRIDTSISADMYLDVELVNTDKPRGRV